MNLNLLDKYIIPNRILDIGANIGQFASKIFEHYGDIEVVSIEASRECELKLSSINPNYHIEVLSNKNEEVIFYKTNHSLTNTGDSIYKEMTRFYNDDNLIEEKRIAIPLDSLHLGGFDIVKIDTQGAELRIIEGGLETIKKSKMVILETSLKPYNEGAPLQPEVIEYMDSIGFFPSIIMDVQQNHGSHQEDILFGNKRFYESTD